MSEILLTVFLKHDQSQNIDEIQGTLAERQWWDRFPPEGVKIDSWYVAMGLGQIVTLRLPVEKLQAVNIELERSAWGVFTTEWCATESSPVTGRENGEASHEGAGESLSRRVEGAQPPYESPPGQEADTYSL